MKSLNKTETPIFYLCYVLCFQKHFSTLIIYPPVSVVMLYCDLTILAKKHTFQFIRNVIIINCVSGYTLFQQMTFVSGWLIDEKHRLT